MDDGSVTEKDVLSEFVVQRHLPLPCQETGTYYLDDHDEGYVGYFSILAAFFWLNVMSFDLWNSFPFDWSGMVYFYGPIWILIIFNTTLFILTAFQIMKVKKELRNIVKHHERKQKLNSDKQE
ncbi:probable G-protein coupled receptor Mth-like 2 [Drosophila willistoni]|uniref:probable G-protein coupled receptor Mth-like 2 n=1 Tax=Drosophila willistoni TaxID=7260 RepID=UPI001F071BE7|nr:probable G-protein coupled receptor Mth-like 2 [Drosophila willistoni]